MIVFSKKSERFLSYVAWQFNKQYNKSKSFMQFKGLVDAKLHFEKPVTDIKFVIDKSELCQDSIDEKIFAQLPDTMYYTK